MRILLVSPYASTASGVAQFVRLMLKELRTRGHDACVLDMPKPRGPAGVRNLILACRTAYRIWRLGKWFEILHCQQLHPQSFAAALVARAMGKGVVITVHGKSPRPAGVRGFVFDLVEELSQHPPHRVVLVAHSLKTSVRSGLVIPNGVPVAEIRQHVREREQIRRELGIADAFVLLFLGRISPDKGFLLLLDAVERMRDTVSPPLRLLAVGPIDESLVEALAMRSASLRETVIFTGEQENSGRFLAAADLFVLPSFHEGLPLSVLEAMAAGLPVIASRVGDLPLVVRPGSTGWLVAAGDSFGLERAILEAIRSRAMLLAMGERCTQLVDKEYSLMRTVTAYVGLYEQVLSET